MGAADEVRPIKADSPVFVPGTKTVRFWVRVDDAFVGATIGEATLHYRYASGRTDDDALATYLAHAPEIDAAVRRRVAGGSREPVMLRDWDVRAGQSEA